MLKIKKKISIMLQPIFSTHAVSGLEHMHAAR